MNKTLKIGLMGVIAVGLIANAYLMMTGAYSGGSDSAEPKTSIAANNNKADLTASAKKEANNSAKLKRDAKAESAYDGPTTQLAFGQSAHDFGTVPQNSENRHVFTFTNTGAEPLIIENAKGSCGCTVPQYPKEPVAPGETGEIEVVYKPGKQKNKQTKTVTITANTEPRTTKLTITANVEVSGDSGQTGGQPIQVQPSS